MIGFVAREWQLFFGLFSATINMFRIRPPFKALKMWDFTGKIDTPEEVKEARAERKNKSYEANPEVSEGV